MEKIYRLFANIFAREPTIEFLKLLQQKESDDLFKQYNIEPLSDIKDLPLEEQAEFLAIEYTRLFLTPGTTTSLRESLQLGEEKLWGESTVKVNKIYGKFGFALDDEFKDTPDHLSAELSFLAELSELEKEYAQNTELAKAEEGVREVKKYFITNHLNRWFFTFNDKIQRQAKLCYYRETSKLLAQILAKEKEELKTVKDIG